MLSDLMGFEDEELRASREMAMACVLLELLQIVSYA